MALGLANNVGALNAQHNLTRSSNKLNTSIERLSSGFKINRGADGPAALVISEKQRAQIAGLRTAIDNTEKAVAVVQTAEGALNEINSLLVKVRSLAIDSANAGVNDEDALAANQAEIANALDTINRVANNTQFGEKKLLDGSAGLSGTTTDTDVSFLKATAKTSAGSYAVDITTAAEAANVTAGTAQGAVLAQDETLTVNGVSITLNAGLSQAQVIDRVNEFTGQTGVVAEDDPASAGSTRLRSTDYGAQASIQVVSNVAAAAGTSGFGITQVADTGVDVAGTIGGNAATGQGAVLSGTAGLSQGVKVSIGANSADLAETVGGAGDTAQGQVTVANNALVFQIGANQGQTVSIAIDSVEAKGLGIGVANNQFTSLNEIDVTSASKAQDTLGVIDAAIDEISNLRGTLGAFQGNTLESTASNMRTTLENTVNAESVIRDTDFAEEISNFTNHYRSGHLYFSLKDENAKVNCVMFRSDASSLKIRPKDGMKVLIKGRVSVYTKEGSYQLYATMIEEVGLGEIYQEFERNKEKLQKEGLFRDEIKKVLPKYPDKVAVVTSSTGAAIQDIINVSRRRNKGVSLIIYPTLVQGEEARISLTESINKVNLRKDIDVIILSRGGGSYEDLSCFNDLDLAYAIRKSSIPVVTGVGHEIDFTIADFVADLRCATPSQAAEVVIPSINEMTREVRESTQRLNSAYEMKVRLEKIRLKSLSESLSKNNPKMMIANGYLEIDKKINQLNSIIIQKISIEKERLASRYSLIKAYNPLNILDKGYALIYDEKDQLVNEVETLDHLKKVKIRLKDGERILEVQKHGEEKADV